MRDLLRRRLKTLRLTWGVIEEVRRPWCDDKDERVVFMRKRKAEVRREVTCVVWRRVRRGAGRSKASSGVFREVCGTIGGVWRRSEG